MVIREFLWALARGWPGDGNRLPRLESAADGSDPDRFLCWANIGTTMSSRCCSSLVRCFLGSTGYIVMYFIYIYIIMYFNIYIYVRTPFDRTVNVL